jgi:hypothetical protein
LAAVRRADGNAMGIHADSWTEGQALHGAAGLAFHHDPFGCGGAHDPTR